MNLQFFADGGEGDQNPQGNPEQVNTNPVNNPEQNNPNNNNPNQPQGTTFSQEEVNNLLAREKAQGRAALLRELGFEKEDDLKGIVTKYNEQKEAGMTACVTGCPCLLNCNKQRIVIAVSKNIYNLLQMTRCRTLVPKLLPAP